MKDFTRRDVLRVTGAVALNLPLVVVPGAEQNSQPIIDIHQHQYYKGRTVQELVAHQRMMGITTTVILPSARAFDRKSDGSRLEPQRASMAGNEAAMGLVSEWPQEFVRFANELPTRSDGLRAIEKYLRNGGLGIGESKFAIDCDSMAIERLAEIAQSFKVPLLMHFQHAAYNKGLDRLHKILRKFPDVNFIGHAQTWWGNIDKNHEQKVMYPRGNVVPGGITDRYLSDFPNMFGDLSAGSGHNALVRDEQHTRAFLDRHQDKLMFGSDCGDSFGHGPKCTGSKTIAAIRRIAPNKVVERKLLYHNAKKLLRIG